MALPAGTRLGPYEILDPIGVGGMGEVYRARDTRLGRDVALKVLPAGLALDEELIRRFRHEARTASALNHPNIVTIHDVGEADDVHYIAMEFVEGQTLGALLKAGPLPLGRIARIGSHIADGLAKAHAAGIVHRDLKPANIMLTPEGHTKILDFGLAKIYAADRLQSVGTLPAHTQEGVLLGTVGYMSPEQAEGKSVAFQSDQFSFGAVLYEIVSGARAFDRPTSIRTVLAIVSEEPEPIGTRAPQTPAPLCDIIERCMAKRPEDRYPTTADLASDMATLRDGLTGTATSRFIRLPTARGRKQRRYVVAALLAVLVLLSVLAMWPSDGAPGDVDFSTAEMLETSEDRLTAPDLSPDGKMVAFVKTRGGRSDVYVQRVAAREPVQITDDAARDYDPDFSPDGERIAFTSVRDGEAHICLVPALGGQVTPAVRSASQPTWSPDGERLAFVAYDADAGYSLSTARLDGSDRKVLLRSDATYPFLVNPAWSPDGSVIALVRGRGGIAKEVWLVPVDGGEPRPLTEDGRGFGGQPVFSADGRGVIYTSTRLGAANLWYTPLDGGESLQITKGAGPDFGPSVSGDGKLVYYTNRWRAVLRVDDLTTGATRELLRHAAFLWAPAFSPDGVQIAFSRAETDGGCHIWAVPTAGGAARQLTFGKIREIQPRYTRDGKEIFFYTWNPDHRDRCFRMPAGGGAPRPATPDSEANEGYGELSPDGTRIVYVRLEGGSENLHIVDAAGGEPRMLTPTPGTVPRWSPDGSWIAFARDRGYAGGIFLIRPDGSDERRLSARGGWPVWWPAGKRVGYLVVGPGGDQQIETIPVDGGPPEILPGIELSGTNHPFDVSADGRLLAVSDSVHLLSEIWMLSPAD